MSLRFGAATPPRIPHPELFIVGVAISLAAILFMTVAVDRLGTAMFKRGFAKPFYIRGRRIHHKCIYYIVPLLYFLFLGLLLLGYMQIVWSAFYANLVYTFLILMVTMTIDFLGDRFWPKIRKNVILHHEWVYTLVPAYILAYMVVVII